MREDGPRKGVITRLVGVALVLIGVLDSMLFWRAGVTLNGVYVGLIAAGIVLFAIGTIRASAVPGRKAR